MYHASHDLRAPITSMLGLIEVSKKETDIGKIKKLIEKQEETIVKLDDYITGVLLLSKIKRTELSNSLTDLKTLVNGVLKQCKFMLEEKEVKVSLNIEADEFFYCDQSRLNIILYNIISNSIKYADDSKLENTISINLTVDKKKLIGVVKDNGIGIESKELDQVSQMFYYNKHQNKGTGLGLYIVKETILKLGGELRIDSEIGEYCQVTFKIPEALKA